MNKICTTCGESFSKPLTCSTVLWGRYTHCSRACRNTSVTIKCRECNTLFKVRSYRETTARFCSQACSHKNRNMGKTTLNNSIRKTTEYKLWRRSVFERDNYTCVWCKRRGVTIHADHIKPFAYYPELRFAIDNGRTLCVECHRKTDTYGVKAWRKFLNKCIAVA